MKTNALYASKSQCCGCSACACACPQNAIRMVTDEYGFRFPAIEEEKCIDCGLCQKVCRFQNAPFSNTPRTVWAGITQNTDIMKSASGGAFASIAATVLKSGGVVYGAAMLNENGALTVKHLRVEQEESLPSLYGSKYVQSDIDTAYMNAKADLQSGMTVLFCGTPCQVDGLYGYLKKKYDNLYTIDLVCHGVPSQAFFNDFIQTYGTAHHCEVTDFSFRNKGIGGGLLAKITYNTASKKEESKYIPCNALSYYYLFLNGLTYRESCYECKYACASRAGDITIGDYWGIEEMHPELLKENGGFIQKQNGCSCIIVNTENGERLMQMNRGNMLLAASDFEKAAKTNGQLKHPSELKPERALYMDAYKDGGYDSVEALYQKNAQKEKYVSLLKYKAKKILKYRG